MSEEIREILPSEGIWTVEDLAAYLEMVPAVLQDRLDKAGVKTLAFSARYKHKLVSMKDILGKIEAVK